eukprot:c6982_g1_i1.p1 GENE.c6982_g1_i1~~c6982_g1_i1.p1  ORF type:complete len:341 (-),score=54.63 c6982_g1_i1:281-1303(-)
MDDSDCELGADNFNPDHELACWMKDLLPKEIYQSSCITEIALPACHNAGAREVLFVPPYAIPRFLRPIAPMLPLRTLFRNLARCQSETIPQLLRMGVRMFDLKLGWHHGKIHICHRVVCTTLFEACLLDFADFLNSEEGAKEILVVTLRGDFHPENDFNTQETWDIVCSLLQTHLGSLLACHPQHLSSPLSVLYSSNKRCIVMASVPWRPSQPLSFIPLTSANYYKTWDGRSTNVMQMLRRCDAWYETVSGHPITGKLQVLEFCLPHRMNKRAKRCHSAFKTWGEKKYIRVVVMLDFANYDIVHEIVFKNNTPKSVAPPPAPRRFSGGAPSTVIADHDMS